MRSMFPNHLFVLPFYSSAARTGYLAIVDGHQLERIRLYRGLTLTTPLGPSDRVIVDIGPVQVYSPHQVVYPPLHRLLNEVDPEHLATAPAWALPDGSALDEYLRVPASEAPMPTTLQLIRSASDLWLQLTEEDAGTVLATRVVEIELREMPEPDPNAPHLLLVIYRPLLEIGQSNVASNMQVLAVPVQELEREIRVLSPFPHDRAVLLERRIDGVQKFWLSDILLGGETERFLREVESEFRSDPSKRYLLRRVRSLHVGSRTQRVSVVVVYRIPEGGDRAIPVAIRSAGTVEVSLEGIGWQDDGKGDA